MAFLRTLMPRKPVSEIYDAIGLNKHGKTELYIYPYPAHRRFER